MTRRKIGLIAGAAAVAAGALFWRTAAQYAPSTQDTAAPVSVAVSFPPDYVLEASREDPDATVHVYRTASCGCCGSWAEHLRRSGMSVEVEEVQDLVPVKRVLGIPERLTSCHTAVVGGYVVEGHVPADVIRRVLAEAPGMMGISVPGMPVGSPGMEVEGRPAEPYHVLAFDGEDGVEMYAMR